MGARIVCILSANVGLTVCALLYLIVCMQLYME